MHTMGRHFIDKITTVDHTVLTIQVEPGQTPLTTTRFQGTIRGLSNKTQQHRDVSLLVMTDDRMITMLQREEHLVDP